MLLVDDLAAGGTKNLRHTPRGLVTLRLRKFRGQQPAGPAGDGKTLVVSAKCWKSWNGHLSRPGGTSPPCFSFKRFIVEQCLLKKTNI